MKLRKETILGGKTIEEEYLEGRVTDMIYYLVDEGIERVDGDVYYSDKFKSGEYWKYSISGCTPMQREAVKRGLTQKKLIYNRG